MADQPIKHLTYTVSDAFGSYQTTEDPQANTFKWTDEQIATTTEEWRRTAESALPTPEVIEPDLIDWTFAVEAAARYKALDAHFKAQTKARRVIALALLDSEPDPTITEAEAKEFGDDLNLIHAQRVRDLFGVNLSVLEGWAVEFKKGTREVSDLNINNKDVAQAILDFEDARRKAQTP